MVVTAANLHEALALARIALAFGRVERVTFHEDGVRPETDTDHTVMLGLLACQIAHGLNTQTFSGLDVSIDRKLDVGLVAQFALVHDLVEVYSGDVQTLTIDTAGRTVKEERERAARERLRAELGECWLTDRLGEYEEQTSPEARFIRVLDKVLPKLTHILNGCAAAKKLTDLDGFKAAHDAQVTALSKQYGDVPFEVHALLRISMRESERAWGEANG